MKKEPTLDVPHTDTVLLSNQNFHFGSPGPDSIYPILNVFASILFHALSQAADIKCGSHGSNTVSGRICSMRGQPEATLFRPVGQRCFCGKTERSTQQ